MSLQCLLKKVALHSGQSYVGACNDCLRRAVWEGGQICLSINHKTTNVKRRRYARFKIE